MLAYKVLLALALCAVLPQASPQVRYGVDKGHVTLLAPDKAAYVDADNDGPGDTEAAIRLASIDEEGDAASPGKTTDVPEAFTWTARKAKQGGRTAKRDTDRQRLSTSKNRNKEDYSESKHDLNLKRQKTETLADKQKDGLDNQSDTLKVDVEQNKTRSTSEEDYSEEMPRLDRPDKCSGSGYRVGCKDKLKRPEAAPSVATVGVEPVSNHPTAVDKGRPQASNADGGGDTVFWFLPHEEKTVRARAEALALDPRERAVRARAASIARRPGQGANAEAVAGSGLDAHVDKQIRVADTTDLKRFPRHIADVRRNRYRERDHYRSQHVLKEEHLPEEHGRPAHCLDNLEYLKYLEYLENLEHLEPLEYLENLEHLEPLESMGKNKFHYEIEFPLTLGRQKEMPSYENSYELEYETR